MKKIAWILILVIIAISVFGQKNSPQEYVEKYYKIAIKKMHEYKIPASITLAQGILESGSGNSMLAQKAKNHFGIKCHKGWTGKTFYMDDDEENECFRSYKSPEASFSDHSIFLTTRSRYDFLFTDYEVTDYKKWAKGLKKAGYATNPAYADRLINIIDKYQLYKYDKMEYEEERDIEEKKIEETKEIEFIVKETEEYNIPKGAVMLDASKGIFEYNRIRTVKAKDRTVKQIAKEFNVSADKIYKYNEIFEGDEFEPMQNVFLQPKRRKGPFKTHSVKEGQSLWEISQIYGVKVSRLRKINMVDSYEEPLAGQIINLRKKREKPPKKLSYEEFVRKKVISENKELEADRLKLDKKPILEEEVKTNNKVEEKNTLTTKEKEIELKKPTIENAKKDNVEQKNELSLFEENLKKGKTKQELVIDKEETEKLNKKLNINNSEEKAQNKEDKKERKTHKVKPGETLYAISKKYNTTVENIVKWNNLPDFNLNVGQELLVSPE